METSAIPSELHKDLLPPNDSNPLSRSINPVFFRVFPLVP